MKDEFGRPFGKKEFLETLVFAIVLLSIHGLVISIIDVNPEFFYPLILLTTLAMIAIAIGVWVVYSHKKQKQ